MSQVFIVVDDKASWAPYYPSDRVISFKEYLTMQETSQRVRVINLCRSDQYLSEGYYCSLLAEARSHHVLPSIRVLNDLAHPILSQIQLGSVLPKLEKALKGKPVDTEIVVNSYFGKSVEEAFRGLSRLLFERFPCPILQYTLKHNGRWEVAELKAIDYLQLDDDQQTAFAESLDEFSTKIWRSPKKQKASRYDMAILVNPDETLPPSNPAALKKFIQAGKNLGINVEIIHPGDFMRIPEYDALFIRETTSIDHHTYRFAKKAEQEGLVVMDDPTSILRCTNKIYLAKLFEHHKVPTPKTVLLQRTDPTTLTQAIETLGFPIVLKIPDGAFSRGVVKVENEAALQEQVDKLFDHSSLLLAQEYLYTDFDWRIGILNNKPIYACRYYMVKNHWQIYRHSNSSKTASGGFDTMATFEVPKAVLQAAMKATKPIGNGLYGVDVKESKGKGYVIEVNDNPNVDSGVEDRYLGGELYTTIVSEFLHRIEAQKNA